MGISACISFLSVIVFLFLQEIVTVDDEQKALCTDDYSDISPLTGGNVAFSTLEGRPSAYNFDRSPILQVSTRNTLLNFLTTLKSDSLGLVVL